MDSSKGPFCIELLERRVYVFIVALVLRSHIFELI